MKNQIVYLVAMEKEIVGVFELTNYTKKSVFGFTTYTASDESVVIVQTGIGKSNAAAAAQMVLQTFPDAAYVNTGVVGSFNRSLKLGQVVYIKSCSFFDVDVTNLGFALGHIPATDTAVYKLAQYNKQKELSPVTLVSGDTFLSEPNLRKKIVIHFNPDVIDMELASIAHVFHLHNKLEKLSSVKAVSDYADGQGASQYEKTLPLAVTNLRAMFTDVVR